MATGHDMIRLALSDVGLNADWCVSAYRLGDCGDEAIFLTDDEDGTYAIVGVRTDGDDEQRRVILAGLCLPGLPRR